MTTLRIEEMVEELFELADWRFRMPDNTQKAKDLLRQALTEAHQAGQKKSEEDNRLLAEEIECLRKDVESARQAGIDEAVKIVKKKKEETPEDSPYRRNQFMKPHSPDTLTTAFRKGFYQALDDTIKALQDNKS